MAVKRTVDLGTVGFGLVADTRSLQSSLRTLKNFGDQVNALSQNTSKGASTIYTKFAQVERILTTLQARTIATTQRMKDAGVAAHEIDKVTKAYQRLNNTLTQQAGTIPKHEIARGATGMSAILQRGNKLAGAQEAGKMALAFRDLERAAILAVGPLSGIGARLAVLAALFESNTAKTALFVAGIAGIVTGAGLLSIAAIKATMDWQKFAAILTVATGSAALVPDEFEYIAKVADKLGMNVRGLVEPYAKFTTAARLSNVPLEDQRKIFEGATTAASAMRLNSERTGLVFLALEQMMSKGVVTMEELRRQLGDLLPGSFGMAAKAMGVTQAKLTELIKAGEVLPQDLLPKMAEAWKQVFGPSAIQSAQSLQGEMNRVGTASFLVLKAFDEAAGTSKAFTVIVRTTANVLMYLARNMQQVLQVTAALAGAIGGIAFYGVLLRLPAIITSVVAALRLLQAAIVGVGVATSATGIGGIAMILGRIALAAGGAYVGYKMMGKGIDANTESVKIWIDETDIWLKQQQNLDASSRQTTAEMSRGTTKRLENIRAEIDAIEEQSRKETEAKEAAKKSLTSRIVSSAVFLKFGTTKLDDPHTKEMRERIKTLQDLKAKLEEQYTAINGLKLEPPESAGGREPSEAWKNWIEGIEKDIRKYESLGAQIEAVRLGDVAVNEAKGFAEALDVMAAQPEKGRGSLEGIVKTLKAAGFEGENLTAQLTKLFDTIANQKDRLKELEALPKKIEELENRTGDARMRAIERRNDQLNLIDDAVRAELRTEMWGAQMRETVMNDSHREMLDQTLLFGRNIKDVFNQLENDIARTFVDIAMGGKSTWKDLLESIFRMIMEFMAKILVIQPIMTGLFGSMFTGQNSSGLGLFGGLLAGGFNANTYSANVDPAYAYAGYARGTDYVPRDMLAMIHQGEKIIPASQNRQGTSGSQVQVSVSVDASGSKVSGDGKEASDLGRKVGAAVRAVLIEERRPGGLLA